MVDIDGKTMALEYHVAKGDSEALPKRARELVDGQPRSFVIRIAQTDMSRRHGL
jgi:hypothetical protein